MDEAAKHLQCDTASNQFTLSEVTMTTHILTQDELKTQLHYNPETGIFTRLVNKKGRAKKGDVAGYTSQDGYVHIRINLVLYKAHRLVWLYVYGSFPKDCIDHINGIHNDNRMANLREATKAQNNQNRRHPTGKYMLGVRMCRGKFQATVVFNRKNIHLGTFLTEVEAHNAYIKAKRNIHEFCTI